MPDIHKIAFVCLHGSAKSLIAAEHCRRLAAQCGVALDTTTSGPEPDAEIPRDVVEGLLADGIDVRGKRPQRVGKQGLADAAVIVSFGCELTDLAPRGVAVERWDDCPAVSDDYALARDFIVSRVERLLDRLGLEAPATVERPTIVGKTDDSGRSLDRRQFLGAAGFAAAGLAAAIELNPEVALAQATQSAGRPPMTYAIKPMPFDPNKVKGMSEKLLVSHYENNYSGAVKRLNAITAQLASLDWASAPVFVVNGLKREELIAANSMILHELFFDGLGGGGQPAGALAAAMVKDFGGVAQWQAEFAAMGKAEGGGSGWVLLCWSPRDKRLVNAWAADHTTNLAGGRPILALDMYEHAYHMDYGAKAAAYVDAFMQAIRWDNVAKLHGKYSAES